MGDNFPTWKEAGEYENESIGNQWCIDLCQVQDYH